VEANSRIRVEWESVGEGGVVNSSRVLTDLSTPTAML